MQSYRRTLKVEELNANHYTVSVHKYGFFLCTAGTARILLGSQTYIISRNCLCIYTPNTFIQILEKSADLEGILEEDDVDIYYPVVSTIDIRRRLQIRHAPCVEITQAQAADIIGIYGMISGCGQVAPSCGDAALVDGDAASACGDAAAASGEVIGRLDAGCLRHLRYALCLKVLKAYFCNTPVKAMPQNRDETVFNRFLVSVYANCHRHRTVQFYASEQNLSPYYFSSIIRDRSGKSALQWISDVTMIFSRQYLECTEMSVKEIADRLCFPDQSAFCRFFRHHEGCTPSEFRAGREIFK